MELQEQEGVDDILVFFFDKSGFSQPTFVTHEEATYETFLIQTSPRKLKQ